MRAVTRLRRLAFRSWLMPLLVGAMACRALAPAGFMTTADSPSPVIAGTLCSLDKDRRERLESPGERQPHTPRCDHCLNGPMGWAPIASLPFDFTPFVSPLIAPPAAAQVAHAPLPRSQTPRAPPPA